MTLTTARIVNPDSKGIEEACAFLQNSDVVGIPTETVYGLAGNARDITAVTKIFAAKKRPQFDPLIVHIPKSWNTLEKLYLEGVIDLNKTSESIQKSALRLMKNFWPGPLTLILPKGSSVVDLVTSGLEFVGVRMPDHAVIQKILEQSQLPLAAPSANRFGRISPTTAKHVFSELSDCIPLIVDGGACDVGVESTVVRLLDKKIQILRPGKVTRENLVEALKGLDIQVESGASIIDQNENKAQISPGLLASHYAPSKPLILVDEKFKKEDCERLNLRGKAAILSVSQNNHSFAKKIEGFALQVLSIESLCAVDDSREASKNLFSALRRLDSSEVNFILVEKPSSNTDLWPAILDRLTRASQNK